MTRGGPKAADFIDQPEWKLHPFRRLRVFAASISPMNEMRSESVSGGRRHRGRFGSWLLLSGLWAMLFPAACDRKESARANGGAGSSRETAIFSASRPETAGASKSTDIVAEMSRLTADRSISWSDRRSSLLALLRKDAVSSWSTKIDAILRLNDSGDRFVAATAILDAMDAADVPGFVRRMTGGELGPDGGKLAGYALHRLFNERPGEVTQTLRSLPPGGITERALSGLILCAKPQTLKARLPVLSDALGETSAFDSILSVVRIHVAALPLQEGVDLFNQFSGNEKLRTAVAGGLGCGIGIEQYDLTAISELAAQLGDKRAIDAFYGGVMSGPLADDPEQLIEQAKTLEGDPELARRAAGSAFGSLAERNAASAFKMADSLPSPELRAVGLEAATREWMRQNLLGASDAVSKLPPDAARDRLAYEIVRELCEGEKNPTDARRWADFIVGDEWKRRAEALLNP